MILDYDVLETRGGSYDPAGALTVTYRVETDGVHLVEARDGAVVLYAQEAGLANPSYLSDAQVEDIEAWIAERDSAVDGVYPW